MARMSSTGQKPTPSFHSTRTHSYALLKEQVMEFPYEGVFVGEFQKEGVICSSLKEGVKHVCVISPVRARTALSGRCVPKAVPKTAELFFESGCSQLSPMPDDAERFRFIADHQLTLHTDGGDYGYMVHWVRTAGPGQPPKFYPVSNGKTAEEAIDNAIARYERKHGLKR